MIKDRQKLFEEACRLVVEDGNFDLAWIATLDPKSQKLNIAANFGYDADYIKKLKNYFEDKSNINSQNIKRFFGDKNLISNDLKNKQVLSSFPLGDDFVNSPFKSVASFPLNVFGKTVGTLFLYSKESNIFNTDEISLIS